MIVKQTEKELNNVKEPKAAIETNGESPDQKATVVKNSGQKKKRKRMSHTCTSCRARKVKCDQGRPCSSCVKKEIPAYLCIYEESPFIPTIKTSTDSKQTIALLEQENKRLKKEVAQLTKTIFPSSDGAAGDDCKMIKLCESLTLREDRTTYNGATSWRALLDSDTKYKDLISSAKSYIVNAKREWNIERSVRNFEYGDHTDIQVSSPDELLLKLSSYLPDYNALESYLELYLNSYWNHTIKVVDPAELIRDFHQLFIKDYNNNTFKIVITNKILDYGRISVILLCLKFVILTLNSIYVDSNIDSLDHVTRYAEKLLDYSNYFSKPTIPALQALILLREVKRINPNEDDGGDGSNCSLLFKTSINMAILMGLNRNIDELYSHEIDRVKTKLKSIWRYLLKQDAIVSFYIGAPLSIEDSYVDFSTIRFGCLEDDLVLIIREADRLLSKVGHCKQSDILEIINKLETYNDGELFKLSNDVRNAQTVEKFMSSFDDISDMEYKINAIYVLHVLYEILLNGCAEDDPDITIYYNGSLKYGTLSVTHLVELLLRLNCWCNKVFEESGDGNRSRLYNITEISTSFTTLSRVVLLKIHCGFCQFIVHSLASTELGKSPTTDQFSLSVDEMETLDIRDPNARLNKLFKETHFLHALITLACKYMLHLNNESFGKVFSMNFCLQAVIALYKYFNSVLQKNLPKDKLEYITGVKANVSYNHKKSAPETKKVDADKLKSLKKPDASQMNDPNYKISIQNMLTTNIPEELAADVGHSNTPTSATNSLNTTPEEGFDFFDWKNDTIDKLFDSLLTEETLYNFDDTNQQLHIFPTPGPSSSLKGIFPPNRPSPK